MRRPFFREDLDPAFVERAESFIRENLPLTEVPGTGGIRLHLAGPSSGLSRLVGDGATPYWAYAWPGGVALARYLHDHPDVLTGSGAWEIGAGSGLVSIAVRRAGQGGSALDHDPLAIVAAHLNAVANGLEHGLQAILVPADADLGTMGFANSLFGMPTILAGDVFYDEALARGITAWFDHHRAGTTILIGDIGRAHLPRDRLEPLACYPVRDVGDPPDAEPREGWVYRWRHR